MLWSLITSLMLPPLTHSALASVHLVCSYRRAFALAMPSAYFALLLGMHEAPSLSTFKSCSDVIFSGKLSLNMTYISLLSQ